MAQKCCQHSRCTMTEEQLELKWTLILFYDVQMNDAQLLFLCIYFYISLVFLYLVGRLYFACEHSSFVCFSHS